VATGLRLKEKISKTPDASSATGYLSVMVTTTFLARRFTA
jgi:hypothetical protein